MPAGQKIRAGQRPGERIGTTTRTATFTNITATEVAVDSVTVALVSGRTYRVRWTVAWGTTAAGNTAFGRLRQDNVSGTQMQINRVNLPTTGGAGTRWDGTIEAEYTATATGNKTFVGTGVLVPGTGSISAQADVTYPIYLTVDYIRG